MGPDRVESKVGLTALWKVFQLAGKRVNISAAEKVYEGAVEKAAYLGF